MSQESIPYSRQDIREEDIEAVVSVLRSDFLTGGTQLDFFESTVARYVGAKHAIAFSSGTAALHAAVAAAGVGAGDEGITSPNTFCATANSLLYQGARPVFADIRSDSLTLDVDAVAAAITDKTKVILPVDYAGHPADLDELMALAQKQGLIVIEDACHAIGATYRNRRVGSVSHMSIFSFHPVKHIAAGEGGMVTTNDDDLAEKCRRFRDHGVNRNTPQMAEEPWHYAMESLGHNFRLDEMSCALGASQMQRVEENLSARRHWAKKYAEALGDLEGLVLPFESSDVEHAWHLYPIRIDAKKSQLERQSVFKALRDRNIRVQVHYIPVHMHPYYQELGWRVGQFPIAEEVYQQTLSLPMFHALTPGQWEHVVNELKEIWSQRKCHV